MLGKAFTPIFHGLVRDPPEKRDHAKIAAARVLGLPVIMIDRPAIPPRPETHDPEEVLRWLAHAGTERGV